MMRSVTRVSSQRTLPGDGDESFSSPLLNEMLAGLDPDTRHVILVPGPANPGILALLQGKRCRLVVADAALALSELDEKSIDADSLAAEVERLILGAGSEKIDAVLCWDLLNYMSPPLMKAFATRLASIMSPGGRLHAYIHSASADMAQTPQQYSVQEDAQVVCIETAPALRKTPRYSYGDLEKHAAGFRVLRSVLLRNGIQEYLLQLRPG